MQNDEAAGWEILNKSTGRVVESTKEEQSGAIDEATASSECKVAGAAGRQVKI